MISDTICIEQGVAPTDDTAEIHSGTVYDPHNYFHSTFNKVTSATVTTLSGTDTVPFDSPFAVGNVYYRKPLYNAKEGSWIANPVTAPSQWWVLAVPPITADTAVAASDIVAIIDCDEQLLENCNGKTWNFGSVELVHGLSVYTQVPIQTTGCGQCASDSECNQRYAERCDAVTGECKHYGWVGFRTDKRYVHEDTGRFAIHVERYAYRHYDNAHPPVLIPLPDVKCLR